MTLSLFPRMYDDWLIFPFESSIIAVFNCVCEVKFSIHLHALHMEAFHFIDRMDFQVVDYNPIFIWRESQVGRAITEAAATPPVNKQKFSFN